MDIQRQINRIIKRYGLTKEDIASRLMVSYESVYRWSKGETRPKSRFILQAIERLKKELENKKKRLKK